MSGQTTIPYGECVQTELLADGKPVDWWPKDKCIQVGGNSWEFLAALGKNGAPERLDPNKSYAIHAWWPQKPDTASTRFPFDLNGPKTP